MRAEIVVVDPVRPDRAALTRAGRVIRAGGLVAFPTETVYGLGAHALDGAAVAGIFRVKGRPANDPVIVHVARRQQVTQVADRVPATARRLMDAFWPGPLTLVLPRAAHVPSVVTAGLETVAVRMPSHPVARGLIEEAGAPVAAPSANIFSRPSATTAAHVMTDLGDRIDMVLDAGSATIGVESTIVALDGDGGVTLLRPGGVPLEEIERVVSVTRRAGRTTVEDDAAPQAAPGLLTRHYSPRARFRLVIGERAAARARLRLEVEQALARGERVGVLLLDDDVELVVGLPVTVGRLGSEDDPGGVAARLFDVMRAVDATGVDGIITRGIGARGLGLAILDRLTRAAAGVVIEAGDCHA